MGISISSQVPPDDDDVTIEGILDATTHPSPAKEEEEEEEKATMDATTNLRPVKEEEEKGTKALVQDYMNECFRCMFLRISETEPDVDSYYSEDSLEKYDDETEEEHELRVKNIQMRKEERENARVRFHLDHIKPRFHEYLKDYPDKNCPLWKAAMFYNSLMSVQEAEAYANESGRYDAIDVALDSYNVSDAFIKEHVGDCHPYRALAAFMSPTTTIEFAEQLLALCEFDHETDGRRCLHFHANLLPFFDKHFETFKFMQWISSPIITPEFLEKHFADQCINNNTPRTLCVWDWEDLLDNKNFPIDYFCRVTASDVGDSGNTSSGVESRFFEKFPPDYTRHQGLFMRLIALHLPLPFYEIIRPYLGTGAWSQLIADPFFPDEFIAEQCPSPEDSGHRSDRASNVLLPPRDMRKFYTCLLSDYFKRNNGSRAKGANAQVSCRRYHDVIDARLHWCYYRILIFGIYSYVRTRDELWQFFNDHDAEHIFALTTNGKYPRIRSEFLKCCPNLSIEFCATKRHLDPGEFYTTFM
jgi:hypothetical protein